MDDGTEQNRGEGAVPCQTADVEAMEYLSVLGDYCQEQGKRQKRQNTNSSRGAKRLGIKGGNAAPPLVDMVTVNGAGAPFAIVTVGGPGTSRRAARHTVPL
jgi:hypothetical protein